MTTNKDNFTINEENINENDLNSKDEVNSKDKVNSKDEVNSKKKYNFKNLMISGGGFNGFQFFGTIKYLDENNILDNISTYIGISVGSFINLLLIIGYKIDDVEVFLTKFDFSKIFDLKFEKILLEENIKGLTSGENFNKLIKKFLTNKDLNENVTLKELYEKTKKNFIVIVTNITTDKIEYVNYENYPELPVYLALRMTSCIPFFFEPIKYKDNYYIDGVIKDNFPIQLIKEDEISQTIAIVLQTHKEKYDIDTMTTMNYMIHLYKVLANEPMKEKIKKYKNLCKIFIIEPKINSFNYKLEESYRCELIIDGYNYCKSVFTNS
jgi:predicted acylesterase/phospholipase RssA